jgi:hypothetical protein
MKYLLFGLLFLSFQSQAQSPVDEKAAVIATVQALFDAMAAKDSVSARALLLPDSKSYITMQGNDTTPALVWSNENIITQMRNPNTQVLERMWNIEVLVHGRIAQLWADYDLYVNGKFRHCGIDAFLLVKEKESWKIVSGAFTIEKTGCKSPPPPGIK